MRQGWERLLGAATERVAVTHPGDRRGSGVRRDEAKAPLVARVVEPRHVHADLHVVEDVGGLAQRGPLTQVLVEHPGDLAALRLLASPTDRRDDGDDDRDRSEDEDGDAHSVSIVATRAPIGDAVPNREMGGR